MFLHEDKQSFYYIIDLISKNCSINPIFIEKDYYVFMLLKLIYCKNDEVMFKGGTSLSKAWGILNRFSEDIDLNIRPEIPSTDSHRMKLAYSVYDSILELGFDYDKSKMSSRREYNTFEVPIKLNNSINYIRDTLKVETMANKKGKILNATYFMLRISNYIYDLLSKDNQNLNNLNRYNLAPFVMPVQGLDVTFVEKVMSLTNRYLKGDSYRVSRHLYDIHQMWCIANLSSYDLNKTMIETKNHLLERNNDICLRQSKCAKQILLEALYSDFYKYDFENITENMKFNQDGINYENCKNILINILNNMYDF